MANAVMGSWLDALLAATLGHTIKAALLGPGYVFNAAHTAPSDLTDVLGTVTLSGLTSTAGVLDANDPTVPSPIVESMTSVFIYDNTDSKLMLFYDQGVGFSSNPNGDVQIILPNTVGVKLLPLGGV